MKWLFLVNDAPLLMEFLGKFASQAMAEGDECIVAINSKIAEYGKKKFFPEKADFVSRIDWCIKNYQPNKENFGDLSWKELFAAFDRFKTFKFNYDNSFRAISGVFQFFEYLFQKEKPDIIVSEPPAGLFHQIAYYFCKKNNIPYAGLLGDSKLENRIDVYDLDFTCSKYKKSFNELNNNDLSKEEKEFAKNFVNNFVSHEQLPPYVSLPKIYFSQLGLVRHFLKRAKESGKSLLKYLINRSGCRDFDYESEAIFRAALRAPFIAQRRKIRIFFQKNIFDKLKEEKFFLFPLHLQPEASTSVCAPYYCDQLNAIKNIAFSIPFPYKLYVKEHPVAVGTRPKEFYKKLKQIPNVALISPYENTENLIKKSSGVITLTSTIGMEAVLSGKPAYVLGKVFYEYHPLCRKIQNFDNLKDNLIADITHKSDITGLEIVNLRFITAYLRNTIIGNVIIGGSDHDTNDYKAIYKNIVKILKKIK